FAVIVINLVSPRGDQAHAGALAILLGIVLTSILAGVVKFAVLPEVQTFAGFSLAIGMFLVPTGALLAYSRQGLLFAAMAVFFIPILAPANEMMYNTLDFYNVVLAVVAGVSIALLAMLLLPPLSPTVRARRLLDLTLRDLRRLAAGRISESVSDWEGR